MIRILIPLITLGCFCVLASYSYGRCSPRPTHHAKLVYIWRTHKAAMIADVWNLTPASLDSKVDILGRRR